MKSSAESADLAEVDRKEIEEESSFGLRGKGDQFAFVLSARDLIDILQIRCLPSQTRTVVYDFAVDFPGNIINERQLYFL
jgi:hypothetical protein